MARLPFVDPDTIEDSRVRAGFDDMQRRMGEVTENLLVLAHKPLYVELIQKVSEAIDEPTESDPVLRQIVELKVARLMSCEYSIDLLESVLLSSGVAEAKLHELDFYPESTRFDDREKLALRLAEQMVLDAVDDELFHEVRQTFSVVETLELVVTIALESFYCLVNRTLGLSPQGFRDRVARERAGA